MTSAAQEFRGGTSLEGGCYRLVKQIGQGGMGTVWLADDLKLSCRVIVKVPHLGLGGATDAAARFQQEVRSLIALSHPHIVKITDVGVLGHSPYAVMQFLDGGSLEDRRPQSADGRWMPAAPRDVLYWLAGHHISSCPGRLSSTVHKRPKSYTVAGLG